MDEWLPVFLVVVVGPPAFAAFVIAVWERLERWGGQTMTCDKLPPACARLGQFTLWARCPCHSGHWNVVAGSADRDWLRRDVMPRVLRDSPGAEVLILPPGECPLGPARKKRRGDR